MSDTTPQEIASISQSIIDLMPVIVGGVVGIISSVVGGVVLHKVQSSDKKEQLKYEKMEKATLLAYECKEWLSKYDTHNLFNGQACTESSPLNELKVLCYLYIPDAKNTLKELETAFNNYKIVVLKMVQEKISNNGMPPDDVAERIRATHLPLQDSVDNFVSEIEKLIQP